MDCYKTGETQTWSQMVVVLKSEPCLVLSKNRCLSSERVSVVDSKQVKPPTYLTMGRGSIFCTNWVQVAPCLVPSVLDFILPVFPCRQLKPSQGSGFHFLGRAPRSQAWRCLILGCLSPLLDLALNAQLMEGRSMFLQLLQKRFISYVSCSI